MVPFSFLLDEASFRTAQTALWICCLGNGVLYLPTHENHLPTTPTWTLHNTDFRWVTRFRKLPGFWVYLFLLTQWSRVHICSILLNCLWKMDGSLWDPFVLFSPPPPYKIHNARSWEDKPVRAKIVPRNTDSLPFREAGWDRGWWPYIQYSWKSTFPSCYDARNRFKILLDSFSTENLGWT